MRGRWTKRIGRLVVPLAAAATIACAAPSEGSESPTSPEPAVPATWQTYSNSRFGFGVSHPEEFGIVPQTGAPPGGAATSPLRGQGTARQRLRRSGAGALRGGGVRRGPAGHADGVAAVGQSLAGGRVTSTFALPGAVEGFKVQRRQQLAPNEFYYFAMGRYIFAVTQLGEHSSEILASFRA